MLLSIIIVNYNVKHFLEQCLFSVQKAAAKVSAEIIVIDNYSTDGSIAYLSPKFKQVRFIQNPENTGFAKACNQGLALATGKYILFLNPDTIVPEDCFEKCISFLEQNKNAGALGIRMLDGSGKFLPESKRAFPSPLTSLYKLFGLSKLFPRSRTFARYHLGHLPETQTNEADVLSGAFMMIKKEVLDKTGGFDENFFMYGEDVDLSFRIQEAGYKNYYFAGSSIIHFKGESTRKGTTNYVRMFYSAMSRFVRKHYGGANAGFFNLLIHTGIWLRAALTASGNFIRHVGLPFLDAGLILLSFWLVKNGWNEYVKTDTQYEPRLLWITFSGFTVFYLITAYYAGLYDRWYRWLELIQSTSVATVFVLAAYALLPEHFRFSRAIILLGALLALVLISILRWILVQTRVIGSRKEKEEHFNTLIAGTIQEYEATLALLKLAGLEHKVAGRVSTEPGENNSLGYYKNLKNISGTIPIREVIYCTGHLSYSDLISYLHEIPSGITLKIHATGSSSIVGSQSKDISGESVSHDNGFKLADPYNKRLKRLADISIAAISILFFPFQLLIQKKPLIFIRNCFAVLFAVKTWVGYAVPEKNLPKIRKGIVACNGISLSNEQKLSKESLQMMDYWYARDYDIVNDLKLIWKVYRYLGN